MLSTQEIFRNLLPHLWLRPERALWDAIELEAVSKLLLPNLKTPSLEYGCTDGLNTFVMLGGKLDFEYDDYLDIPDTWFKNSNGENYDFFDAMPKEIQVKVMSDPIMQLDLGLSWKMSHLSRATRLGVYKSLSLMEFNRNDAEAFGKFETIWAPQLFWTRDELICEKLADLHSMLNENGNLITIFPNDSQKRKDVYRQVKLPEATYKILDSGISNNLCKNARTSVEWERIFDKANLVLEEKIGFMDPICGGFYQFGFRPMFIPLLKMHSILHKNSEQEFLKFKQKWIETIHQFIDPLIKINGTFPSSENLWTAYRLKRKRGT